MKRIQSWRPTIWLLCAAVLTFALQYLGRHFPLVVEEVYGNGVYRFVRAGLDKVKLPVAGLQLMMLAMSLLLVLSIGFALFRRKSIKLKLEKLLRFWLSTGAILVLWFYLFWGFNYARQDLTDRLRLQAESPDRSWFVAELNATIESCNRLCSSHELAYLNDLSLPEILSTDFDVEEMNKMLETDLSKMGYSQEIRPRLNFIKPAGFLMHWSTTGIYWPFTGEANVDRGVHLIKKPVTIVHELAHAHGLTSEGDCNFVAYLVCRQSPDTLHQYSANLSYLGYLMRDALGAFGRNGLEPFYERMSPELKTHRAAIRAHHDSYKDYFPDFRDALYDSYLKSQGISSGMENYNYFVTLKYNWDKKYNNSNQY